MSPSFCRIYFRTAVLMAFLGISMPVFCQSQTLTQNAPLPAISEAPDAAENTPPQSLLWLVQKDEKGKYYVRQGSQFKVRLNQDMSSDSVQQGTPISVELVEDMKAGPEVIAKAGQQVLGIVSSVSLSRKTIKSYKPGKNFLDAQGRIGFSFSGIVASDGSLIKIDAVPSEKTIVDQVKKTKAKLMANKNGEYVVKYAVAKYAALDVAIGTVGLATGPVGIVTSALVSGVAGSVNKNFAAGRPVEADENYTKKEGFIMGVGRGLPGGFLIQGMTTSGKELELHKGDVLTVSLREDLRVGKI
ncbi:MAG: hypothetical protein KIT34_18245 [Cyanobacteria bacterium TGS_CYA1]|nr:hypothetical protein [Cyanobacteria bacterium TGS_CYA1]